MKRLLLALLLTVPVWSDNAELTLMFEEDQSSRMTHPIQWDQVTPRDVAHRQRVQELLVADQVTTGQDYYHAAFIFQHGDTPDDCLLAHTLALLAAQEGVKGSAWIACASLDRYLQRVGQPQIYGTQYRMPAGGPSWDQQPIHAELLPDTLRVRLGVPPLPQQQQRLQQMNQDESKGKSQN